jgi:hypothetical protein
MKHEGHDDHRDEFEHPLEQILMEIGRKFPDPATADL